jgi:hypothetical protein
MKIVTKYESNRGRVFESEELAVLDDYEYEFEDILNSTESLYMGDCNCNAISDFKGLQEVMSRNPEFFDRTLTVLRSAE